MYEPPAVGIPPVAQWCPFPLFGERCPSKVNQQKRVPFSFGSHGHRASEYGLMPFQHDANNLQPDPLASWWECRDGVLPALLRCFSTMRRCCDVFVFLVHRYAVPMMLGSQWASVCAGDWRSFVKLLLVDQIHFAPLGTRGNRETIVCCYLQGNHYL